MKKAVDCQLCGLPVPTPPIEADGHGFCCPGCRAVYTSFGPAILDQRPSGSERVAPDAAPEGKEAFLRIDGMHCSSCEILIERLAENIPGVLSAFASYATSTAKVVYDPDVIVEADLPQSIRATGYQARLSSEEGPGYDYRLPLLRLLTGVAFGGLVMMLYVAFFYPVHLGVVDDSELESIRLLAHVAVPWVMCALATGLIVYVAAPIFRGAWIGLRAQVLNMDNLLAIAILAAYFYSVGQLLTGSLDLYFDVVAAIITVVTVGRYFERKAKAEATRELSNILEKWAPKARIRWGGGFRWVDLEELDPGEHVVIREGEPVPVDGVIVYGEAALDESLMTGEPFPVDRNPGDEVLGGSVVVQGSLEIRVGTMVESQMDNLARVLWNVQSSIAGTRNVADRMARLFVPAVLFLAAAVTLISVSLGNGWGAALLAGLATLIVSCPCTFGLAIPLTTAVGVSTALRKGIIVTSADAFEKIRQVDIVAIDKTGTLSTGDMAVTNVLGIDGVESDTVAMRAAAVERSSPHPVARAIARLDESQTGEMPEIHQGRGAEATVDGSRVAVGSALLFTMLRWPMDEQLATRTAALGGSDKVISYVGWDGHVQGAILTSDRSRPNWDRFVDRLRLHCRVVLLTGAEHPSEYESRVDTVFSGVPPEGKAAVIRRLRDEGSVVMIGDGSNDAPALAAADLGIAFGTPTSLAAEAADIIIPGEQLERIFTAFDLVQTIRRRVRQNLGWALLYNAVAIPLAVTGMLNPLFAALAMSSSSILVVWNSSRSLGVSAGEDR